MQALYSYKQGGGEAAEVIDHLLRDPLGDDRNTFRFAERLFLRTIDHQEETDALIEKHAENWDLARIALIDRVVLRMALTEFLTFEDIPPKVTINEAIEIVKRYSTEKSGPFINGILDAALLDLQQRGRLQKSGRGLIGMQSIRDRQAS
jgi:N utilization substance protein B